MVRLNDILYIQSNNNYAHFVLNDNRKILVSQTLKSFENKLQGQYFFRCHQSFLVNLKFIQSIDKKKDTIHLIIGDTLPIAKGKRKALMQSLEELC
ncbi:LytTR family DNA-binding domain-containing protein [uncultured Croceitalea sp.]|uniref:LytR/AlgR family response regulator transcription factor n=1 Tax=uncultured Croceitalea sp. TaxID=1798908 RepID=UPI0033064904